MKKYTFAYGRGTQSVYLPQEHVHYEMNLAAAEEREAGEEIAAALQRRPGHMALQDVVGPDGTVVIIVNDGTRKVYTEQMLDALMAELHRLGVGDEQVTVLIATGSHRPATDREIKEICGPVWSKALNIRQHDCRDAKNLTYIGTTKYGNDVYVNALAAAADTVILTGGISFHDMAGFSGGRKAVLPGIAGYDTIMRNHSLALNDTETGGRNLRCDAGILDGNAMHEDMMEGASFLRPAYLVNTVLNADGSVAAVVAGRWDEEWKKGCAYLMERDSVPIAEPVDVVIASAGGYPKDVNFYQATKAHMNAVFAVKPGGIMILVMECPDIGEPPDFAEAFLQHDRRVIEQKLREHFTISAFSAYKTQDIIASMGAVIVVTRPENKDVMEQCGQIFAGSLEDAWQIARRRLTQEGRSDYTIAVMPYAAATLPVITGAAT